MPNVPDNHKHIARGVDRKSAKTKIKRGYCEESLNVRHHASGKIETRPGFRSHSGVLPSGSSQPVRDVTVYRSEAEEYPVAIANGNLYERVASTASTTVNLDGSHNADFKIGPAFYPTGTSSSLPTRDGGYVLADTVVGTKAVVTGASYDEDNDQSTFTISLPTRTFGGGASALSDFIKTTSDTVADWIIITQMSYAEYNGTFQIVSISEVVSGGDSTVTVVVENATGDLSTPDEVNGGGYAELATNILVLNDIGTLEAGDEITDIYDDDGASSNTPNNTITIRTVSTNTVAFNMFTEEDVTNVTTLGIRGKRTTDDIPVVADTDFTAGNVLYNDSSVYSRGFRVLSKAANVITIDDSIIINHGETISESHKWSIVAAPGGTGDLVPSNPSSFFSEAPTARVRATGMQDSIYYINGTDEVMKYDGADIYRAGLIPWQPDSVITVDIDHEGIVLTEVPFSSCSGDPDTDGNPTAREITFYDQQNFEGVTAVVDKRTGRRYDVRAYDSTNLKLSVGSIEIPLPDDSTTLAETDYDATDENIDKRFNLPSGVAVVINTSNANYIPAELTAGTTYYTVYVDDDNMALAATIGGAVITLSVPAGSGASTFETVDNSIYIPKRFSYYYKLNAVDVNNNIIASAVTGFGDYLVDINQPGQIIHKLTNYPAFDQYDYDRIELEVYRTKNGGIAPFYRIRNAKIDFDQKNQAFTIIDTTPDISLGDGDLDATSVAIKGAELPVLTTEPPIAKYISSAADRLVLSNIKTTDIIDLTISRTTTQSVRDVNALSGTTVALTDADASDTATFEFLDFDNKSILLPAYNVRFQDDGGGNLQVYNYVTALLDGTNPLNNNASVGDPVSFTDFTPDSALPSNIVDGQKYYIHTLGANDFLLSETLNGSAIAYVDAGTGASSLTRPLLALGKENQGWNIAGNIHKLHSLIIGQRLGVGISSSSGDLTIQITDEFIELSVGERIKFYTNDGSSAFLSGLEPNTEYFVESVVDADTGEYTLSTTSGGAAIAHVGTTGAAWFECMDAFYIQSYRNRLTESGSSITLMTENFTAGDWLQVASFEHEQRDFFVPPNSDISSFNGDNRRHKPSGVLGRFMGWWKVASARYSSTTGQSYSKIKFTHGLSIDPDTYNGFIDNHASDTLRFRGTILAAEYIDAGDAIERSFHYPIYIAHASTSGNIPIICATTKIKREVYRDYDAGFTRSDTYRSLRYLGEAFNSYQRQQATPWAYARFGSTIGIDTIKFIGALSTTDLSMTITKPADDYFDSYINQVRGTSGNGQTRLFPSRLVRSYENFPEIFDNPFADSAIASDSIIDVNPSDGQQIVNHAGFFAESTTGDSQLEDIKIVFKTSSVWAVNIRTKQKRQLDSQGKGCTAPDSVAPTKNGIIFANEHGIYRVRRNLEIDYVGENLESWWKDNVNKSSLSEAIATVDPHERLYKLALPTGDNTTNNYIACYDYDAEGVESKYGAWFHYDSHDVTSWAFTTTETLFGTNGGDIMQIRSEGDSDGGDYQDDTSAITFNWVYGIHDFGDPTIRKKLYRILTDLELDGTDITDMEVLISKDTEDLYRSCGTVSRERSNVSNTAVKQSPIVSWTPPTRNLHRVQVKITHEQIKEKLVVSGLSFRLRAGSDKNITENADG